MLDLLNPTPTQKLIERELLFGTRDVCVIGTARAGKGVAAVKGMTLRSQYHKEMGIGSGDYILIAQSVGAIHRNSKAYFGDVCKQLGIPFRTRGAPDPHFDVGGAKFYTFGGANADAAGKMQGLTAMDRWVDEATLCREDVYEASDYRLSFEDSRTIVTSNAGSPWSWVKELLVDKPNPDVLALGSVRRRELPLFADQMGTHQAQQLAPTAPCTSGWSRTCGRPTGGSSIQST